MAQAALLSLVKRIFQFGPLLFGLGFLAPLISQSIVALGWTPPSGASPVFVGVAVGGLYGLVAQMSGRWI